jgi:hypothetical protein
VGRRIWVAGEIRGLGADAKVHEPDDDDLARVHGLLRAQRLGRRRSPSKRHPSRSSGTSTTRPGRLAEDMSAEIAHQGGYHPAARTSGRPRRSATSSAKAELGRYQIRGFSTFQTLPTLDDLVFLPA